MLCERNCVHIGSWSPSCFISILVFSSCVLFNPNVGYYQIFGLSRSVARLYSGKTKLYLSCSKCVWLFIETTFGWLQHKFVFSIFCVKNTFIVIRTQMDCVKVLNSVHFSWWMCNVTIWIYQKKKNIEKYAQTHSNHDLLSTIKFCIFKCKMPLLNDTSI